MTSSPRQWRLRWSIGRMGRVEEIARAVLCPASDAASFITGESLKIDGGFTAQ